MQGLQEHGLELRVVGGQHDQDEHDGVDEHAVVVEAAQGLGQYGQHRRGDYGAPDVAESAQHDEHEDEYRGVEVELSRSEVGEVQAIERARGPGQGGRSDKGHELILGDVYAHALGGDTVVAQSHDGASGAAAHEI